MKMHKTIAVITAEVFDEYTNRILVGIADQGKKLGYDVGIFLMSFNNDSTSPIQIGEENIYNLINSDVIDGVIFICGNFNRTSLVKEIEEKLIKMNVPIIAVDCESSICESLNAKDTELFELITDHFIEVHNCHEIMCLTGMEHIPQAQSRLLGYKNALKKHNIPVRDDLIVYGDFWKATAKELAKEFISGKRKLPQAIVCANDIMAVTLCNNLVNNGIKIPADVLISGYDGSHEAMENVPSITTIFPLNYDLGARAVCFLHEKITGEKADLVSNQKGFIITAMSCGCGENIAFQVENHERFHDYSSHYDMLYRSSGMMENLLETESIDELIKRINNFGYLIHGLDVYMLCLCDNWDHIEDDDDNYIRDGYSENMNIRLVRIKDEYVAKEVSFKSAEILPPEMKKYVNGPDTYFFLPMHFKDRCFGYSVLKFDEPQSSFCSLYATWCRNINIALEYMRVRTKLISVNQRISLNSIRDTLTGIYNRKGFKRFSETIFKKAKLDKSKILIIVADLDMLKSINDNYGHIEGDNAITVAANVLNTCCQNNEVCSRIGGDEYAIVGCFEYTDKIINEYIDYINNYFDRYNATSSKPYPVGASLGLFCGVPDDDSNFEQYFNIADKRMYENKFERKKCRLN